MLPFFFFSSRRRHTRWPRDWSSDVCSSDLTERRGFFGLFNRMFDGISNAYERFVGHSFKHLGKGMLIYVLIVLLMVWGRSEERRVGKGISCGCVEEG